MFSLIDVCELAEGKDYVIGMVISSPFYAGEQVPIYHFLTALHKFSNRED